MSLISPVNFHVVNMDILGFDASDDLIDAVQRGELHIDVDIFGPLHQKGFQRRQQSDTEQDQNQRQQNAFIKTG